MPPVASNKLYGRFSTIFRIPAKLYDNRAEATVCQSPRTPFHVLLPRQQCQTTAFTVIATTLRHTQCPQLCKLYKPAGSPHGSHVTPLRTAYSHVGYDQDLQQSDQAAGVRYGCPRGSRSPTPLWYGSAVTAHQAATLVADIAIMKCAERCYPNSRTTPEIRSEHKLLVFFY